MVAVLLALIPGACGDDGPRQRDQRSAQQNEASRSSQPDGGSEGSTSPAPPELRTRFFHMPSGNIGCLYAFGSVRCDIASGLRPQPALGICPEDQAWVGVVLTSELFAEPNCAGDGVIVPTSPELTYGQTWSKGDITCKSHEDGLRCQNSRERGFTLSRAEWVGWAAGGSVLATPSFLLPSGNIYCLLERRSLRCDIGSGLQPEPDECQVALSGDGVSLNADGPASPTCDTDGSGIDPSAHVLDYGKVWERAGITCRSEPTGLRCTVQGGAHGFELSRARWDVF